MKYIFSFFLCLFSIFSFAQHNPPQQINSNYQFLAVGSDSVLRLPKVKPGTYFLSPWQLFANPQDSSLRVTSPGGNSIKIAQWTVPTDNNAMGVSSNTDPAFIVHAYGIPAIRNNYNPGDTIKWSLLDSSDGHGSSFFTSVYGDAGTHFLTINYPLVRNVLSFIMTGDETLQPFQISTGCTVGFNQAACPIDNSAPIGLGLNGANSTTWSKAGQFTARWNVGTFNTGNGQTLLDLPAGNGLWGYDPSSTSITYVGTNNYHIQRQFSGLGTFTIGFTMVDNTNTTILTQPTGADHIIISGAAQGNLSINTHTFDASNTWFSTSGNMWVDAWFDAWFVCRQIDSGSVQVKFHTDFPSATNYKIYRGTSPTFGSQTLVYTGTLGSFIDTGLTPNTQYYYTYVATVAGVDTQVSTWQLRTYPKY